MSLLGKRKGRPISRTQFEAILNRFLVFLKRELRLTYDIPVILVDDADFAKKISAFGEISKDNVIHLSIINRHPMDILRTLAHEYVHYKQHMEKGIDRKSSHAGSPTVRAHCMHGEGLQSRSCWSESADPARSS